MTRIAPVRLAFNPKILWFEAGDLELGDKDYVVVTTNRGLELGQMAGEVFEAKDEQVKNLKSPLKPVERVATDEDREKAAEMERLGREALPRFRELAAQENEDMHPVSVEYLLDGDKAVFYFEAEERIDFRELVRKLASEFHVRVDMRQIGSRDEARMIGGLGHCGQELCCKRLGGEFNPVTIKMAKEQGLSLNPQKISGTCGRLMCCLRYEYEAYKDFNQRAPKVNAKIQTPDGIAKVTSLDVPKELVTLSTEDGKSIKVPLADFDPPEEEGVRPSSVGEDAWECAKNPVFSVDVSSIYRTDQFTGKDALGEAKAVHRSEEDAAKSRAKKSARQNEKQTSGKSRSTRKGRKAAAQEAAAATAPATPHKRRRTTKVSGDSIVTSTVDTDAAAPEPTTGKVRPGQRSSGLRASEQKASKEPSRRSRRGRGGEKSEAAKQDATLETTQRANATGESGNGGGKSRRPRRRGGKSNKAADGQAKSQAETSQKQDSGATVVRRNPRRRSHKSNPDSNQGGGEQ